MLVEYAHRAGRAHTERLSKPVQRTLGQFMTPHPIARFMAQRLVQGVSARHVRVLEPAAGAGILAAAVVEELLALAEPPETIQLLMCELDEQLVPVLQELGKKLSVACRQAGVELAWIVQPGDFLLSRLALSGEKQRDLLIISNPPFLKLNKALDPRAAAHAYAVHGQPNIYALFMAACARLAGAGSRWCFITPRSWMSGAYFRKARQAILHNLSLDHFHVFESRTEGFEEDGVLQETVITWASSRQIADPEVPIMLTRSQGACDLDAASAVALPVTRILSRDDQAMLSLPESAEDPFEGWTATLRTYGLEVSTGPVVAFRAEKFIGATASHLNVPLLWLQHIGQQQIRWPIGKKREYIKATAESAWMLLRNQPMVVMRRFSPKEDERRVTCASYEGELPGPAIGLENHLNYIHRPGGSMSIAEARGLSAFLASKIVDSHFRALAGSTQVNAVELRKLPLPPLETLISIGASLPRSPSLSEIDRAVGMALAGLQTIRATAA